MVAKKRPAKRKPVKKATKAEMELVLALQKRKLTTKELANVLKGLKSVNTKKYMPERLTSLISISSLVFLQMPIWDTKTTDLTC